MVFTLKRDRGKFIDQLTDHSLHRVHQQIVESMVTNHNFLAPQLGVIMHDNASYQKAASGGPASHHQL